MALLGPTRSNVQAALPSGILILLPVIIPSKAYITRFSPKSTLFRGLPVTTLKDYRDI